MNKRLRILQVFNRYLQYGGEEGSVYRIGDALQKLHDVEYLLYSTSELLNQRSSVLNGLASVFYNRQVLETLRRYQEAGKFHVWQIHNVFPAMSPVVYREALKRGIPIVHYLHNYRMSCVNGMFLNHGEACQRCIRGNFFAAASTACWHDSHIKSGIMGLVLTSIRQMDLFSHVKYWIAISQAQKDIHIRMGVPSDRIRVVHHFFEPKGPALSFEQARDVVYVGRLSQEKGVGVLLDAWKRLATDKVRLRIVGEGPELTGLVNKVREERIRGVIFEGFKKPADIQEIWQQSLFSVVPSIWEEPFGMTVLESWARGRAVLASHIGALPELIQHGETGWLARAGDPEVWASVLDHILSNPEEAATMGFMGRKGLEEKFNEACWLRQMDSIYKDILP
ncbi:MAG: glycosyltransferase family 4 protein [Candidatus Methylacidiphilales bacterium]|nr:glycosyltransferase family 4 protein [Candidatus Methylacidiphilales bacterium]